MPGDISGLPLTVQQGANQPVIPREQTERILNLLARERLVLPPGLTHLENSNTGELSAAPVSPTLPDTERSRTFSFSRIESFHTSDAEWDREDSAGLNACFYGSTWTCATAQVASRSGGCWLMIFGRSMRSQLFSDIQDSFSA